VKNGNLCLHQNSFLINQYSLIYPNFLAFCGNIRVPGVSLRLEGETSHVPHCVFFNSTLVISYLWQVLPSGLFLSVFLTKIHRRLRLQAAAGTVVLVLHPKCELLFLANKATSNKEHRRLCRWITTNNR